MANRARINLHGKRTPEQGERIGKWIAKWRERLHVTGWTFDVAMKPKPHARDPQRTIAQIDVNERYADATLYVYPRIWKDSRKEQERAIVHEMIHAPMNRVANMLDKLIAAGLASKDDVDDAYEELTEYVTNVAWDAYER